MRQWMKGVAGLIAAGIVAALVLGAAGYREAVSVPVVRHARVALPDWPAGAAPVRIVLWSDAHGGDAATDADRLARIAGQVAALRPDLLLIAGDLVAGHEAGVAARVAPGLTAALARVKAPLGTIVVLGNHDHWTGAAVVREAVRAAGATVLTNEAIVRGPLAIGGVDDDFTGRARLGPTLAALRRLAGARLLLSYSPDVAPKLPRDVPLLLTGHSHCGQVVLPWWGPITLPLRTGARYMCGVVREENRTVIVGAGTGTSVLPIRLGAPPDLWVVEVGPAEARRGEAASSIGGGAAVGRSAR